MAKNSYFQFKQFRINQSQSAMKVCTDSCILGAYTSVDTATYILDIGTGTGLLALMLAQRTSCKIDAVEIDENAVQQARTNVSESPWPDQIHIIHDNILTFTQKQEPIYDLIICNPPFFSNHLKRKQTSQNIAMHSEMFQLTELAQSANYLLSRTGKLVTLLPPYESTQLEKSCQEYGLFKYDELQLFDYTGGKQIRSITSYSFLKTTQPSIKELDIKTSAHGIYTDEFIQLLKPYYLHL